jgi:hypothetical protein
VTRITSPLLGRSHYTKYRMPPVYNTHTPSYIYNIYPLMEHHPKKPQLCRNTSFIFQPSSFYLFCFACSFQTQVGQGDYCQMSVCLTSDKQNKRSYRPTICRNETFVAPPTSKNWETFFLFGFMGLHIFLFCTIGSSNRMNTPRGVS